MIEGEFTNPKIFYTFAKLMDLDVEYLYIHNVVYANISGKDTYIKYKLVNNITTTGRHKYDLLGFTDKWNLVAYLNPKRIYGK